MVDVSETRTIFIPKRLVREHALQVGNLFFSLYTRGITLTKIFYDVANEMYTYCMKSFYQNLDTFRQIQYN